MYKTLLERQGIMQNIQWKQRFKVHKTGSVLASLGDQQRYLAFGYNK